MNISNTPIPCSLDVYNGCRQIGTQLYVTGQPDSEGYTQIANAGVKWVVCVRNPDETTSPPPFDDNEAASLLQNGVLYVNVPVTHGMTQGAFNDAATVAVLQLLILQADGPLLIHCSSGDRASAVYAVAMIAVGGASNQDAADYAQEYLLLANQQIIDYVLGYEQPSWLGDLSAWGSPGAGTGLFTKP